ncbi:MAG TPA: inorganic phosphate transporter [Pyrinomonadaceae bacterium]|nr:inorganic phosphate transporter [Pyrinomonadaceae bacterium]
MDAHTLTVTLVVVIIGMALIFDYVNGFHDAANSIATVVATKVLSPGVAVAWAAFFNFIALFVFHTEVADTIRKSINTDLVNEEVRLYVVLSGLIGAIIWNLITWYLGLPTSSSHALLGGLGGAGIAAFGGLGILKAEAWIKTVQFIVLSPLIGMTLGFIMMVSVYWIFHKVSVNKVDKVFRVGQLFSAAAFSLGHGGNDAQKTMGVMMMALVIGFPEFYKGEGGKFAEIPYWVMFTAHLAIGLGTLSGGWRIIKTMGTKIAKLQPVGGFCAETAGALTLFGATFAGIPVSTTHTITGAIVGVGATKRFSAVKWGVAGRIVWAWFLTIPAAAIMAMVSYYIIHGIHDLLTK